MKTLVLSNAESEAILHVRDVEATGHHHSETSCPLGTRALCRHRDALRRARSKFDRADRIVDERGNRFTQGQHGHIQVSPA